MDDFPECDVFADYRRTICRGEWPGMSLNGTNSVNQYRESWGIAPLIACVADSGTLVGPDPPEPPAIVIRGISFAVAMSRWGLAGMPIRSREEIDRLLAICESCEFFKNAACLKCGCACNAARKLNNKLALATEACPVGKW